MFCNLFVHSPLPPALQAGVIADIVLLSCVGIQTVLVHGGGPEINTWLDKVGIKPEFKNGLRVTDGRKWGQGCDLGGVGRS
jgi:acetylglutamate kinase